jgi:hypothetical protein
MVDWRRLELHFDDGLVEVADDLQAARSIASRRPDHDVVVWAVSPNDLGLGSRIARFGAIRGGGAPEQP